MTHKIAWLLGFILLLSAGLRLPGLHFVPPELFGDELDVGYQAYSLLQTGRDIYQNPLPTMVHSLSEWRLPLIVYQTVPTIKIFGLTEYGVRLPEAVFGVVTPILLFLLVYQFSKSKNLAFFSAVVLSVTPWHIMYSRMAGFGVVSLTNFLLLGTLLFIKRRYVGSSIFFALSLYTYGTALVFLPFLIISLVIIFRQKPSLLSLIVFLICLFPFGLNIISGSGSQRFSVLNYGRDSQTLANILELRELSAPPLGKIFNNRPTAYLNLFAYNYLKSFSTEFLFTRGDPVVRHSLQVVGQTLPIFAPFLVLGVILLFKNHQWFWLVWFLVAPLPSALTLDGGFHATRLFLLAIPLAVATATGLIWFFTLFKKPLKLFLSIMFSLVFVFHFAGIIQYYIQVYPIKSAAWWQMGYKQVMADVAKHQGEYTRILINNTYEPSLPRFLFWTQYSPAKFQKNFSLDQPLKNIVTNYDGFTLDGKYFFGTFTKTPSLAYDTRMLPGSLYVISQRDEVPGDWDWRSSPPVRVKVLSTVTDHYDRPLFYLVVRQ